VKLNLKKKRKIESQNWILFSIEKNLLAKRILKLPQKFIGEKTTKFIISFIEEKSFGVSNL